MEKKKKKKLLINTQSKLYIHLCVKNKHQKLKVRIILYTFNCYMCTILISCVKEVRKIKMTYRLLF